VSTVRASSLLWCLIDLDVLDNERGGVEAFGVCVGFGVAEKTKKELSRLDGPASLRDTKLLACCVIICQPLRFQPPIKHNSKIKNYEGVSCVS
jgi:hypothetical protein